MKKLTFCARFQTIVDLGAIKLLKKWNAEIKKKKMWNAYKWFLLQLIYESVTVKLSF